MKSMSPTHPSRIFGYCPRCGSNQFSFDREKLFSCHKCNLNYYLNPAPAVCGILELGDGRIILTRRKFEPMAGMFDLPGGFVDTMETAEDALTREIHEELGLTVNHLQFLASFPNEYVFKGVSYFTCDLAFIAKITDESLIRPADDVSEAIAVFPKEIDLKTISFPSIIKIIKKYIQTL